ncbi:CDGSH iron-sulfur domain-containing protein [Halobacterium yunchengense]|uniref:CDGSH iron-sulfur domain-containing protein n=1 Tax=Halobacterium yunchengense TaxID=3108497 RepID=UPI00300B0081
MTRLVEHDATGPRKLDESDLDPEKGDVAVCQCGLSGEFPFCDGTHRQTDGESDGVCYRYVEADGELRRRRVERVELADGGGADPDE